MREYVRTHLGPATGPVLNSGTLLKSKLLPENGAAAIIGIRIDGAACNDGADARADLHAGAAKPSGAASRHDSFAAEPSVVLNRLLLARVRRGIHAAGGVQSTKRASTDDVILWIVV